VSAAAADTPELPHEEASSPTIPGDTLADTDSVLDTAVAHSPEPDQASVAEAAEDEPAA
jgi:hypothetical protein